MRFYIFHVMGSTSLIGSSHLRREGESVRLDERIDNLTIYIYVFG